MSQSSTSMQRHEAHQTSSRAGVETFNSGPLRANPPASGLPVSASSDPNVNNDGTTNTDGSPTGGESDHDVEMVNAQSNLGDTPDIAGDIPNVHARPTGSAGQGQPEDILDRIPGLFRLLDLIDEHGSGGIVEKVVIDQRSLYQLLNTIQPGSYDSVSKINFKILDKLSIKPTGLYGTPLEIIKFLQEAQCLDTKSVEVLSRVEGPEDTTSILRSGLYLAMPKGYQEEGSSKTAYIIYWPEATTWDDRAASSSVRRNRITFMRYLTKLTEQIFALVSPSQAHAFIWDRDADNQNLPTTQRGKGAKERLCAFEVATTREQDEDAIPSPGFTVPVESKHLSTSNGRSSLSFRLVPGEQKAALLVLKHDTIGQEDKPFAEVISSLNLRKMINSTDCPIQLGNLSLEDLLILASNGLREKHSTAFETYDRRMRGLEEDQTEAQTEAKRLIDRRINEDRPKIKEELQNIVRMLYHDTYPSLQLGSGVSHGPEMQAELQQRYPGLCKLADDLRKREKLDHIANEEFQTLKAKWMLIHDYLKKNPGKLKPAQVAFVNEVLKDASVPIQQTERSMWQSLFSWVTGTSTTPRTNTYSSSHATQVNDPAFVDQLRPLGESHPELSALTREIYDCLRQELECLERRVLRDHLDTILSQSRELQGRLSSTAQETKFQESRSKAFEDLIDRLTKAMVTASRQTLRVDSVRKANSGTGRGHGSSQFRLKGARTSPCEARKYYSIYPLELTEQDSQLSRIDGTHIPQPKLETTHKFAFAIAEHRNVEFLQLVHDKCLVVVSEPNKIRIYLEEKVTLQHSINQTNGKVMLTHDSLGGPKCMFSFDEATRLLAILHDQKELKLSIYICDKSFTGLKRRGTVFSLKRWYNRSVSIYRICFVSGLEEICLTDTSGCVRIFSLKTQQFRHTQLQLNRPIVDAFSAPDGSCLLVVVTDSASPLSPHRLLVFHWDSFGVTKSGIDCTSLPLSNTDRVATRFEGRGRIHIISLDLGRRMIISTTLEVKRKTTEFSFRSDRDYSQKAAVQTFNNSLIDCHLEVWSRFPVVPAVTRNTLSPINRQPRKLTFASAIALPDVEDYYAQMISTFENTTQKPMGTSLSETVVSSTTAIENEIGENISEFQMGSFILELLCMIPLHLAITRDNRFIPLKDGVWDPDYERTLLGAEVSAIIDTMSLGWYESLFRSYMATKPVRVVSSMGEQSVGKSYCLNHFADTSFAGSAMRTTEGVWLSCTPTESYLLVSLDFEGVQSVERSAQEDALLVLFNTAISNLVLFRNNFAMSRDITGLFNSFQSSANLLDPNRNRELFNSTLAIIIKDVTDADTDDIVREFSLKFRSMVEKEQGQNFISRLHRGRMQIIPWPVINSSGFYSLFLQLREYLDRQPYTHTSGGTFLHTLKTLMAKIKTSDWGALDQSVAAHRAQQLMDELPNALCRGRTEEGPLKNLDTDEELHSSDHMSVFFVPDLTSGDETESEMLAEQALQVLIETLGPASSTRFQTADASYVEALQKSINETLDRRLDLVQQWVTVNVERFPQGNQDIRNLLEKLQATALAMRNAVRLCPIGCFNCRLSCLHNYKHSGEHHCRTDHRCIHYCQASERHEQIERCGLPAGHEGMHLCDVRIHLCGSDCHLSNTGGCAKQCVKPLFHKGKHTCSSRTHLCGQPCSLRDAREGPHGGVYNCPSTCNRPWDEPHERHVCNNERFCPMKCFLCPRLCYVADHLHGLDSNVVHICGQEHKCSKSCEVDGICKVDNQAFEIQEQFSGQYASFTYTQYKQIAKKLPCVVRIPPGQLKHEGSHTHDTTDDVFHFCEAQCPNCKYFCTLPLGHPQQLHETSHGSMIATQWVIEADEESENQDAVYELQGRKFGSGDGGAPMMCSLVCAEQGRHAHIDFCNGPDSCDGLTCEHISTQMQPDPEKPKDWISHSTFWTRSGFKDPYTHDQRAEFAKCDAYCAGPEHQDTGAKPSYCTLSIFHVPQAQHPAPASGYVSSDGHSFECRNPSRLHQSYHVVFVIDSSGSMTWDDRKPLPNQPISNKLSGSCNNRYGAVLSALYGFWLARESTTTSTTTQIRPDSYSVITFDHEAKIRLENDVASTTDQLVEQLIPQEGCGGTDFKKALAAAQVVIERHWNTDRAPVVVFLSDGECWIDDKPVSDICHTCVRLGKPLAFYSISFGTDRYSGSLQNMAKVAHEVYSQAAQDVLSAARGNPCSYVNAVDSIELADTFLGIARSMQKPRAALATNT